MDIFFSYVWAAGADSPLYLLHEDEKRLTIVLPLLRQFAFVREFVTAHIHRQLKTVGVQIAEIIHTCQKQKNISTSTQVSLQLLAREFGDN